VGTVLVCLLAHASASGQAGPEPKPQMAEEAFKNIQVLRGIPVDEFMDTMGMFSAALSLNCVDCHAAGADSSGTWDTFADETALKGTTRRMILMVSALNRANFGGARRVTCWTCHRGDQMPKNVPSLAVQYSEPPSDPNDVEIQPRGLPGAPSADQVFEKYFQAIGGAQRVASLTSFAAKGTYAGYETAMAKVPVEVFAKAPNQRATVVHTSFGASVRTYDGRAGWIASPDRPAPLMPLTGGNLAGARIEALASFPAQIKQAFSLWRVGQTSLDDRDVQVLEGTNAGQPPVKLFFDKESGLLVRLAHFADTAVGRVPTQIDYADYRDVAGVKVPFRWMTTWTTGQATTELTAVRPNVPIDAAKFARPAPAPRPKL
jgi:photosynthetic reaction center cytochrome c subunit